MDWALFLHIVGDLEQHDIYLKQHYHATGRPGFTTLQKVSLAVKQLASGTTSDAFDDYLKMGQTTQLECFRNFCDGDEFLRKPTVGDLERLLQVGSDLGFPGVIGSVDCMHWEWRNWPTAWHGQYQGR